MDCWSFGTVVAPSRASPCPSLLRASHIKPWADCESDAERLDIFNGFLLAPHLDAAFDAGFITVGDEGEILVSELLREEDRRLLGLDRVMKLRDVYRRAPKIPPVAPEQSVPASRFVTPRWTGPSTNASCQLEKAENWYPETWGPASTPGVEYATPRIIVSNKRGTAARNRRGMWRIPARAVASAAVKIMGLGVETQTVWLNPHLTNCNSHVIASDCKQTRWRHDLARLEQMLAIASVGPSRSLRTARMPFLPLPTCRRMKGGQVMSTRELIAQELGRLSERDLDRLLAFVRKLEEDQAEAAAPAVAAESALAKDWLSPEEDAAWANL